MNFLFSDRTPFVLALLLALLSWQANELFSEIRLGRALIYELTTNPPDHVFGGSIGRPDGSRDEYIALKVVNPSRDKDIGPFSFSIACRDPSDECLTGDAFYHVEQPTSIAAETPVDMSKRMTRVRVWDALPPGAVLWLLAKTIPEKANNTTEFKIAYETQLTLSLIQEHLESGEKLPDLEPVRLINGESAEGSIATDWVDFLFFGIYLTTIMIFIWFVLAVGTRILGNRSEPKQPKPDFTAILNLSHSGLEDRIAKLEAQQENVDNGSQATER